MEFGVNTFTRGAMDSRKGYMAVAAAAERQGFAFLSVNDHVVVPRDIASRYPYSEEGSWAGGKTGHNFDQLATLAFLAGCTEKLKLLSSVMVVPHRQPVLTAKMLSSIDVFAEGRLIVGCGAGWMKEEFEALETKSYHARGKVTDEYIEAFKVLWTADDPVYDGEYAKFSNLMFEPKPYRKPHPPIWIGGESPAAMKRAARLGDAWYPGSLNPQFRIDSAAKLSAQVAELRRLTEAAGRKSDAVDIAFIVLWQVDWTARKNVAGDARQMFTGSSADMAEDVAALAKAGVKHLNLSFQVDTVSSTIERMQRFAEEVMPLVRS
jgi:probable F420-dependent oxidoreductase